MVKYSLAYISFSIITFYSPFIPLICSRNAIIHSHSLTISLRSNFPKISSSSSLPSMLLRRARPCSKLHETNIIRDHNRDPVIAATAQTTANNDRQTSKLRCSSPKAQGTPQPVYNLSQYNLPRFYSRETGIPIPKIHSPFTLHKHARTHTPKLHTRTRYTENACVNEGRTIQLRGIIDIIRSPEKHLTILNRRNGSVACADNPG